MAEDLKAKMVTSTTNLFLLYLVSAGISQQLQAGLEPEDPAMVKMFTDQFTTAGSLGEVNEDELNEIGRSYGQNAQHLLYQISQLPEGAELNIALLKEFAEQAGIAI